MSTQCAGFIIPPLPAKVVGFLQGPEFLEQRRAGLERFLRKAAAHAELRAAGVFRAFLEASVVELTALKADAAAAASLATPRHNDSPTSSASFASPSAGQALSRGNSFTSTPTSFASVVQRTQVLHSWWGKACQRLAENAQLRSLAARAGHELPRANTIEDAAFDADVQYLAELAAQVRALKAKTRAARQQNKLAAGSYCDLIETLSALGEAEQQRGEMPAEYFSAVLALLDTRAKHMDAEMDKLTARVDGLGRWVKAVQRAVAVREDRRLHYQAQLAAHASASDADEPAADKQAAGQPLSDELLDAKDEFEQVHARVTREIQRFRADKAGELRKMFLEFAALQLRGSAELADVLAASSKTLEAPLPERLRGDADATGGSSFYDSASSVGSGSGDENSGARANQAVYPAASGTGKPLPTKARGALQGAVAKAKASLAGAADPSYSDVRL